jgi:uncharacterized LabA/DUF88 family protein
MSQTQKNQQASQSRGWWVRRKRPHKTTPLKGNYAFIDSQNLNLGVQKAGWKMDWHKFREWLRQEYNVTQAYMFIGYMQENEDLYQQMYDHGFLVVLKPTVDINNVKPSDVKPDDKQQRKIIKHDVTSTKDDKPTVKGNIDADLVLYAMKEIPQYHKAVIVSGDGDFFGLIEYLAAKDKLLQVLAPNWQYSTLLKNFEPYITDLHLHRARLAYRDFRRSKAQMITKAGRPYGQKNS